MEDFLSNISLKVNEHVYLKDPESSKLGKKIIQGSIYLIEEFGFEAFTFKKLANHINSTEASIYRYFENKYKLLQYLSALYWGILEYRLVIETNAVEDSSKKLLKALKILTSRPQNIAYYCNLNQLKLRNIVISEFTKSYHHKHVDSDNDDGNFKNYKRLVLRLVEMIKEAKPEYEYPKSLACQIIEGALQQYFMQKHFTTLVDNKDDEQVYKFFKNITTSVLNLK
jgi:AcrR family transcriptional regulator